MCSSLEYADVVWDGFSESDSNLLESLQIEGTRVVTSALKGTNRVSLLNDLSWVDLNVRRKIHKLTLMYKTVFNVAPPYLCDVCPNFVSELGSSYSLRSANNLCLPLFVVKSTKNHQFKSETVFHSRCLQAQPFKIPEFSILQLSFLHRVSFSLNFSHSLET